MFYQMRLNSQTVNIGGIYNVFYKDLLEVNLAIFYWILSFSEENALSITAMKIFRNDHENANVVFLQKLSKNNLFVNSYFSFISIYLRLKMSTTECK